MLVFGCLLCFLAGAGTVLGTLCFLRRMEQGAIPPSPLSRSHLPLHKGGFRWTRTEPERDEPERDREQEKLREQWENFLSYNGTEQRGGF